MQTTTTCSEVSYRKFRHENHDVLCERVSLVGAPLVYSGKFLDGCQPKYLVEQDDASSRAYARCEEEGLKCNPSSSDVLIAVEEMVEGLGGWRACLPPPVATLYTQPTLHVVSRCIKPFELLDQMHQTLPTVVFRCTKPFRTVVTCTSNVSSTIDSMCPHQ